ncbi:hydrolase-related protein [Lysobacter dokdonensis DS-58]|uniref:Hydrolase-related protein n=1 Tax=Lysobacter dokdonensis DS-58 TaxID=1300345 RepID=A0A0A2WJZ9_9GAMM|nr:alpha/beta hydrolase [Lysobacter dokdonensis]KGQ18575.1 hydrolase-related protein [Lysobacter dokdonensis DS-58]
MDTDVASPGGRIFVRRWPGGNERAPIVLLHDSLGSVEQWRDFPRALADATQRDIIAYDRLGFGRSGAREARPSIGFIDEEALVFSAIADALGLARFVLFGHSVGGAMALAIAAAETERCEAVVTESAQAFVEARTLEGIRAAKAAFGDDAQFARLAKWHGDKAGWVLDAWTGVWLSTAFAPWSVDAHLPRIACPVLVIHGERDEFGSTAFPERIARGVRDGRMIVHPCGHVPHRECPADVLRWVAAFLDRE